MQPPRGLSASGGTVCTSSDSVPGAVPLNLGHRNPLGHLCLQPILCLQGTSQHQAGTAEGTKRGHGVQPPQFRRLNGTTDKPDAEQAGCQKCTLENQDGCPPG